MPIYGEDYALYEPPPLERGKKEGETSGAMGFGL
jgi:hypothetical protein